MEVKILSGWSNPGGSTTAFINLTNLLNSNGVPCIFYGAHDWHLDKCSAGTFDQYRPHKDDILISHFIKVNPICKKHIYSCHEKGITPLNSMDLSIYNYIVFVNEDQRKWHNVKCDSVIIPNVYDNLKKNIKQDSSKGTAAVIGSIDTNKQTHVSIGKALDLGFKEVLLFGKITDDSYFINKVKPLLSEKVKFKGYLENKQEIYDSVEAVFLSSKSEVDPLVKGECYLTGTKFYGNKNTNKGNKPSTKEEVFNKWVRVFNS